MTSPQQTPRSFDSISDASASEQTSLYDLVCIGFGAAQLATAIANREARTPSKALYVERKQSFSWHSGSHTSRTRMESPFIYDLATLRNPRTAFSYVNYLLARKRLIEFANSDRLNPLREEFDDYMEWAAEQFKDEVRYGSEVVGVVPETDGNNVRGWKVAIRNGHGKTEVVRARNVVAPSPSKQAASTPEPLPTVDFLAGQRIMAIGDYAARRNELRGAHEPRLDVSVIGSGRQIVEVLDDLLTCPRLGNITVVTEDNTLSPLTVLNEQQPPQPQLCSIWAKPAIRQKESVTEASELVQTIYMRAYEKQIQTKGQYKLHVVMGKDAAAACSKSNIIIRDTGVTLWSGSGLLQSLDTLVLGCRQKGDSLREVQFKRGAVAEGCRVWLISSQSEGGRALAKDIAVSAGEIVRRMSSVAPDTRDGVVQVQARM